MSQTGLSEMELQDILSIDNNAIDALFRKLNQPKSVLKFPWFFILRILHELESHLILRPDNGLQVLYWRHKLFAQVVNKNYIGKPRFMKLLTNFFKFSL